MLCHRHPIKDSPLLPVVISHPLPPPHSLPRPPHRYPQTPLHSPPQLKCKGPCLPHLLNLHSPPQLKFKLRCLPHLLNLIHPFNPLQPMQWTIPCPVFMSLLVFPLLLTLQPQLHSKQTEEKLYHNGYRHLTKQKVCYYERFCVQKIKQK